MGRHILTLKQIANLAKLDIDTLDLKLQDTQFRHGLAKKYAMRHKLHNGATLEFPADGYRNTNLLFWDNQNKEIVECFNIIDDYGSVPPRFVVGDGYFEPFDWLDEVDHNSFVFPARPLINEMKEFAQAHPDKKQMTVTINSLEYTVTYDPSQMKDRWDSCVLDVFKTKTGYAFEVFPGEPAWRATIVD